MPTVTAPLASQVITCDFRNTYALKKLLSCIQQSTDSGSYPLLVPNFCKRPAFFSSLPLLEWFQTGAKPSSKITESL